MKHVLISISLISFSCTIYAQEFPATEAEFDSIYEQRIQLEEIDGVYIPRNLDEAFVELKRLSSPTDLRKFQNASESTIRTKLHFGLGRWMIVNWGFYEGSRLSHFLRGAGLQHPDDMARVILVCFHRHLNQKELNLQEEVAYYQALREKVRLAREGEKEVLSEQKHTRKE